VLDLDFAQVDAGRSVLYQRCEVYVAHADSTPSHFCSQRAQLKRARDAVGLFVQDRVAAVVLQASYWPGWEPASFRTLP
jgi:hypothetical protein